MSKNKDYTKWKYTKSIGGRRKVATVLIVATLIIIFILFTCFPDLIIKSVELFGSI